MFMKSILTLGAIALLAAPSTSRAELVAEQNETASQVLLVVGAGVGAAAGCVSGALVGVISSGFTANNIEQKTIIGCVVGGAIGGVALGSVGAALAAPSEQDLEQIQNESDASLE